MTRLLAVAAVSVLAASCVGSDDRSLGAQTVSGAVRLTDDSFGLLVYPCVPGVMVSEVVLLDVELDPDTLDIVNSRPLLRERFPQPQSPNDLVVSTALDAPPAVTGADREIIDTELLARFNTDANYLTTPDSTLRFLKMDAFDANGADISGTGGASLEHRFTADVGEVAGLAAEPIAVSDLYCPGREPPAWSVTIP